MRAKDCVSSRRLAYKTRFVFLCSATIGVAMSTTGCGSEPSPELKSTSSDSLAFGYTEPVGFPTTGSNPFSSGFAGTGYIDNAGTGNSDIFACRSCSFTNYIDLSSSLRDQEQSRNL